MDVRRVFAGLNVIAAGLILLANSLGYLPWSVWWNIVSLWPLLLVAVGLDILGRALGQDWLRAASGLVVLGGLAYGALLMPGGASTPWSALSIGSVQGVPYEQTLARSGTASEAALTLSEGASDITIASIPPAGERGPSIRDLVTIAGRSARPVPRIEAASAGRVTAVRVSHPEGAGPSLGGSTMTMGLATDVLWRRITLETGASDLKADFGGLYGVAALDIQAGAASVMTTLGAYDCSITVDAGASAIAFAIPSGSAVEIVSDSALVGADLPGFTKASGSGMGHTVWTYSPVKPDPSGKPIHGGYIGSYVTINASMGAGSLSVRMYRPSADLRAPQTQPPGPASDPATTSDSSVPPGAADSTQGTSVTF